MSSNRISTVSYRKQRPFCTEHSDECWQENRQKYFVYQK